MLGALLTLGPMLYTSRLYPDYFLQTFFEANVSFESLFSSFTFDWISFNVELPLDLVARLSIYSIIIATIRYSKLFYNIYSNYSTKNAIQI
jgi:hypothetical protein